MNVIDTRGQRLALNRVELSGRDDRRDAFRTEAIGIVEIDSDNRMKAYVAFDVDGLDAAFEELDARYLAGEAAPNSRTWSVVAGAFAAVNRHDVPELTPDWVNVDHRQAASFAPGEMAAYTLATWEQMPDVKVHVEAVHRLTNLGAVVTQMASGTLQEGFHAEWHESAIYTVEDDRLSRCELFDDIDLDAAIARFDGLSRPEHRLDNAASQVYERFWMNFAARDWTAMTEILADDIATDDRRRVVNAGIRRGRDTAISDMRVVADVGTADNVTSTVIATRGERLTLNHIRSRALQTELLNVAELNADGRLVTSVVIFDLDDIDAAFDELDARYLAGEAAAHVHTWSVIASGYTALNRHEVPLTTPDFVNIDHRRGIAFVPGDLIPYIRATFEVAPDISVHIEAVHRLSNVGAVITHAAHGTSAEGFNAVWREIGIFTVDGDRTSRCEMFDAADPDAAVAAFDELNRSDP